MTTTSEEVRLTLAPGSLGVGIYRQETNGTCVVSQKNNAASPLQVGDVIVRLNGVTLADIKDGVKGWVALFQASASRQRNRHSDQWTRTRYQSHVEWSHRPQSSRILRFGSRSRSRPAFFGFHQQRWIR